MPVLMVACGSTDGSFEYFDNLRRRLDFQLDRAPWLPHGKALDRLLPRLEADHILLVDSDAEILGGRIIEFFRDFIDEESVFGRGLLAGRHETTGPSHRGAFSERGEGPLSKVLLAKSNPPLPSRRRTEPRSQPRRTGIRGEWPVCVRAHSCGKTC